MRYSDIVEELEKDCPGMDIDDIHKMVGERLKDVKERLRNSNTTPGISADHQGSDASLSGSINSPSPRQPVKRRRKGPPILR
jgi:hypothetical protein